MRYLLYLKTNLNLTGLFQVFNHPEVLNKYVKGPGLSKNKKNPEKRIFTTLHDNVHGFTILFLFFFVKIFLV